VDRGHARRERFGLGGVDKGNRAEINEDKKKSHLSTFLDESKGKKKIRLEQMKRTQDR